MRWLVTNINGETEDVGAMHVEVKEGCLLFTTDKQEGIYWMKYIVAGYAPGQWLTFETARYA